MPFFLKKKNFVIFAALIALHLILISLQIPRGREDNYFKKIIFYVSSPIQHAVISSFQKFGETWNSYFVLRDVKNQNDEMRKEIFYLNQENHLLRNLIQKLRGEKEIRDALQDRYENIVQVRTIGLDFSNYYKSIIINKGSLDGIKKDMIVLDKLGYLVGRVIGPVSLKESRVQLVTDNDSRISVFTEKKRIWGMLTGDGEGQCYLEYVLRTDDEVQEGQRVITSGYDRIYPPGIAVGNIVSISQTTELFKEIKVMPFVDFRNLGQIAVIKIAFKEFF